MKIPPNTSALAKLANLWAKMYYSFGTSMIEQLGEEQGKALLVKCIRDYAKLRGNYIAQYVKDSGLAYDVENFVTCYDSSWGETQKACLALFPDKTLEPAEGTTFCPFFELWEQLPGGRELGLIYCEEFHVAMWKAYHPDLRVEQEKIMTRGDDICTFETYMEGQRDKTYPIFNQKG